MKLKNIYLLLFFLGISNLTVYGFPEDHSTKYLNSFSGIISMCNWPFLIDNSAKKVGSVSLNMSIKKVKGVIPSGHNLILEDRSFDGDDDYAIPVYNLYDKDRLVLTVLTDDESEVVSIMVLDERYNVKDTGIHVGSTFKELKEKYSIERHYFNIADGLYVYCYGFNGVFMIDLEGKGGDFEDLSDLSENNKIEAIVITNI